MSRIDRRSLLVFLVLGAASSALALVPEKASRSAPLEVTYYYLPG